MSDKHAWQMFFSTATSRQTMVSLNRPCGPAFHLKLCIGTFETLHNFSPKRHLIILTYGFGPRHVSQTMGKSVPTWSSVFWPGTPFVATLVAKCCSTPMAGR